METMATNVALNDIGTHQVHFQAFNISMPTLKQVTVQSEHSLEVEVSPSTLCFSVKHIVCNNEVAH